MVLRPDKTSESRAWRARLPNGTMPEGKLSAC